MTVLPANVKLGSSDSVNLTCNARGQSPGVMFMSISKVKDDGSVTPLVELIPYSQQPIFLDDDFLSRSQAFGSLDSALGEYLTAVIHRPKQIDGGRYRCDINYVHIHGVDHLSSYATVTVS